TARASGCARSRARSSWARGSPRSPFPPRFVLFLLDVGGRAVAAADRGEAAPGRADVVAAQALARARVAADLPGPDPADDRPGALPRLLQQLRQLLLLDHVAAVEVVAGEVTRRAGRDDAARAPVRGPAERVVDAADRLGAPMTLGGEQVEGQLQLRPLLELVARGDARGELVVVDQGAAIGGPVNPVDRPVQAPA